MILVKYYRHKILKTSPVAPCVIQPAHSIRKSFRCVALAIYLHQMEYMDHYQKVKL